MVAIGSKRGTSSQELHKVKKVQFCIYSEQQILKNSVCEVTSWLVYNQETGLPAENGINDPRMGVSMRSIVCQTCFGSIKECPGHFGHMKLAEPVYNVEFLQTIYRLVKCVCYNCSRLLVPPDKLSHILKIRSPRKRLAEIAKHVSKSCLPSTDGLAGGCGKTQPKYLRKKMGISIRTSLRTDEMQFDLNDSKRDLTAREVYGIFKNMDDETIRLLGLNTVHSRPENMIIRVLIVAPPAVRPSIEMSATGRAEDDLTHLYQSILATNLELTKAKEAGQPQTKLNELIERLQNYVSYLMNNSENKAKQKGGRPIKSISQRLKGKEGRLRGNLMGKRVDFSARTVVSPDPSLELDQLGVPKEVAVDMTIPETVTQLNIERLKRLVDQGDEWPGARFYISKVNNNEIVDLKYVKSKPNLQYGDVVERHLMNDDFVLFNRQPSLHRMSIMGHRVRVLPGLTFRLNLAVTTPYNADFDGDEMNMHAPQSLETKAEVKHLMHVPKQIVTPQSNRPVMGLNQDSLMAIRLFTYRDTFLTKEQVFDLLMQIDDFDGNLPKPALIKPTQLWTGKQVLSLVLPKINYFRYVEEDAKRFYLNEDSVIIRRGELLSGLLNKSNVGPTKGSIIGCVWIDFGPDKTRDFFTYTQKIVNNWLLLHGFTVGISDTIISPELVAQIEDKRFRAKNKFLSILQDTQRRDKAIITHQPGKTIIQSFEIEVNKELNNTRGEIGKILKDNVGNENNIKKMILAGSKGSDINISQITGLVGQQNVEGQRILFGFRKRTLPHFLKDDYGLESRGFVSNSYYKGLTPEEFFFHTMGGREGLIDTAVKTSQTGYMQRRLVKALEDVMVQYDGTVRDSHGNVIQFVYGEDGIAGEFIEEQKFDMLELSDEVFRKRCCFFDFDPSSEDYGFEQSVSKFYEEDRLSLRVRDELMRGNDCFDRLFDEFKELSETREFLRAKFTPSQNLGVLPVNLERLINYSAFKFAFLDHTSRQVSNLSPTEVIDGVNALLAKIEVMKSDFADSDTSKVAREQNSAATFLFRTYLKYRLCSRKVILEHRMHKETFNYLLSEVLLNFNRARAQPGEMAGSIAAQSIGETLTQMTLNTFHFAGVSEKNVTLGVPRIQEIINCSHNIKGPSMTVFMDPAHRFTKDSVGRLISAIEYTTLSQVAKSSEIFFDPDVNETVVTEDQDLIFMEDDLGDPSPWVLRLLIDPYLMGGKLLKLRDIVQQIQESFPSHMLHVTESLETANPVVLRLRLLKRSENDYAEIKKVEQYLLQDIPIKGFCRKVSYVQKPIKGFTANGVETVGDKAGEFIVETLGSDLRRVLRLPLVDKKRCTSNDIWDIFRVFGIEAVRSAIIREVKFQLENFGIAVNSRHLALLADTITSGGQLMSISRNGINRVYSSPFRKCSFEETVDILIEAAVFADIDTLKGVTENIMMGQLCHMGTGSFDLVMDKFYILPQDKEKEMVAAQWKYFPDLHPVIEADNEDEDGDRSTYPTTPNWMVNTPAPMGLQRTPQYDGGTGMFSPYVHGNRDIRHEGSAFSPLPVQGYSDGNQNSLFTQAALRNQGLGNTYQTMFSPILAKKEYNASPHVFQTGAFGHSLNTGHELKYSPLSPHYNASPMNLQPKTGKYGPSMSPMHQNRTSSPYYSPSSNESPKTNFGLGSGEGGNEGANDVNSSPFSQSFGLRPGMLYGVESPGYRKTVDLKVKEEEKYSEEEEEEEKEEK
jgi:DNA-directed RNA polymerase II subunit RPB1